MSTTLYCGPESNYVCPDHGRLPSGAVVTVKFEPLDAVINGAYCMICFFEKMEEIGVCRAEMIPEEKS